MIEVRDLRREFVIYKKTGRFRRQKTITEAVKSVNLEIARGEAVGYVGPNGAGKSTTMKMLTGLLVPSSGYIRVCGFEPSRQRRMLAARIGVVFGQRSQLWWDLPLQDSFDLLRSIYRVPAADFKARFAECIELLELSPFLATPVRQLSLGQRMRGEVTAALLHSPELLVLDEPTIGLDLESKARLREFLAELNTQKGTTLLLTTHDLEDIERICPRLVVIDRGTVLADGPLEKLRAEVNPERILIVDFEKPTPLLNDVLGVVSARAEADGMRQYLAFHSEQTTAASLITAIAAQAEIRDLTVSEAKIETVIRELYART